MRNFSGDRVVSTVPVDGGDATEVTKLNGAAVVLPSRDQQHFLYERGESLWIQPRTGGMAREIARPVAHGMWAPDRRGACYLNYMAAAFFVDCVDVASRVRRRAASLGYWPRVYGPPGFAVSADGKWIFYQRVDQLESNVMLSDGLPPSP